MNQRPTEDQLAKLPRWARTYVAGLESQLSEAEAAVDLANDKRGTGVVHLDRTRHEVMREKFAVLEDDSHVGFEVRGGSIEVARCIHDGEPAIKVCADDVLRINSWSSNLIFVRIERC